VRARALVNATGPWVREVAGARAAAMSPCVCQGSHIAAASPALKMPTCARGRRARRVRDPRGGFTLIGTTEILLRRCGGRSNQRRRIDYLLELARRFFAHRRSARTSFELAGVRPLYDDKGGSDASAVTRDYRFEPTRRPARRCSRAGRQADDLPPLGRGGTGEARAVLCRHEPVWTAGSPLPGGDLGEGDLQALSTAYAVAARLRSNFSRPAARATGRSPMRSWARRAASANSVRPSAAD
jgi:glycerol-3-phosphate dehydrogenase